MINLIAKKTLEFHDPSDKTIKFLVLPGAFVSAPDWIAKDPLYGWTTKDGTLTVSTTVQSTGAAAASTPAASAADDKTDTTTETKATAGTSDAKATDDKTANVADAKTAADSKTTGK